MEIGKANYGGNKKNKFKIEDGNNIYRILPPLGSAAQKGMWNVYIAIEWGYKTSEGKYKPFQDCRVKRNGMVEVESPAHLFREALKAKKDEIVKAFKDGKATEDDVKKINELVMRYNLNKKYYLNVINLKGEIGLLPIGYKAMQGIREVTKAFSSQGVDPLSVNDGRFFNIFRSGRGLDTMYQVTAYKENVTAMVEGQETVLQRDKKHVLDEAIIGRLSNEAYDLLKFKDGYPKLSPEDVQTLVDEGPSGVDKVFEKYNTNKSTVEQNVKADLKKEQRSEAVVDDKKEEIKIEAKIEKKEEIKIEEKKEEIKIEEKKEEIKVSPEELVAEASKSSSDIDDFLSSLNLE